MELRGGRSGEEGAASSDNEQIFAQSGTIITWLSLISRMRDQKLQHCLINMFEHKQGTFLHKPARTKSSLWT